jgi:hypothetical protein
LASNHFSLHPIQSSPAQSGLSGLPCTIRKSEAARNAKISKATKKTGWARRDEPHRLSLRRLRTCLGDGSHQNCSSDTSRTHRTRRAANSSFSCTSTVPKSGAREYRHKNSRPRGKAHTTPANPHFNRVVRSTYLIQRSTPFLPQLPSLPGLATSPPVTRHPITSLGTVLRIRHFQSSKSR